MNHFRQFGLVVNSAKTNLVLFRSAQRRLNISSIRFGQQELPLSRTATCLGVVFQEYLRWDAHLDTLAKKCYAVIASLRRLREVGLARACLIKAYRALFEPVLSYCIAVWGGGYACIMDRLQIMQNDALRAITCKRRRDSVEHLFDELKILNVKSMCRNRQALLAFRILHDRVPDDIKLPLSTKSTRTTRQEGELRVPLVRRELSRHAPLCRLPSVWNSLPREIRDLTSAMMFKDKLLLHFFT